MGQRHRFSSGVKFPSSPFGHFQYTSWTSGSCIQCVQSLRHHAAGCSREGFKPPVEDSPLTAKANTRKQPVCGGCSSTPNTVISHSTCKLVDLFYDGAAHAFSCPSTHSPNITCFSHDCFGSLWVASSHYIAQHLTSRSLKFRRHD